MFFWMISNEVTSGGSLLAAVMHHYLTRCTKVPVPFCLPMGLCKQANADIIMSLYKDIWWCKDIWCKDILILRVLQLGPKHCISTAVMILSKDKWIKRYTNWWPMQSWSREVFSAALCSTLCVLLCTVPNFPQAPMISKGVPALVIGLIMTLWFAQQQYTLECYNDPITILC